MNEKLFEETTEQGGAPTKEASASALAELKQVEEVKPPAKQNGSGEAFKELEVGSGAMRSYHEYAALYKQAQFFCQSGLVPDMYRGAPNSTGHANTFVAMSIAREFGVADYFILRHLVVVGGRPSMEAQLAIALAKKRAPIKGPIRYEFKGEGKDLEVVAWCIDRTTGDRVEYSMSLADAHRAGWVEKKGSHWKRDPKLMLRYRAATYLIRTHYPEAMMGISTTEEMKDAEASEGKKRGRLATRSGERKTDHT